MTLFSERRADEGKVSESVTRSNTAPQIDNGIQKEDQKQTGVVLKSSLSDDVQTLANAEEYKIPSYAECRQQEICSVVENKYAPFLSSLTHLFSNHRED